VIQYIKIALVTPPLTVRVGKPEASNFPVEGIYLTIFIDVNVICVLAILVHIVPDRIVIANNRHPMDRPGKPLNHYMLSGFRSVNR